MRDICEFRRHSDERVSVLDEAKSYSRYLLIGGSFLYVLGLMMVSLATQYYSIFLAQGLTVGLGIGFIFVPAIGNQLCIYSDAARPDARFSCSGAISHHFKRRRALATGIAVSGSSVGGKHRHCAPLMGLKP